MGTGKMVELNYQSSLLPQNGKRPVIVSQTNRGNNYSNNCNGHGSSIEDSNSSRPHSGQTFSSDITAECHRINIGFHDISYSVLDREASVKKKVFASNDIRPMKTIMHDISGEFKAGELTAIMGPSGSGKTTLLNILAGYKTNHEGSVLVNDYPRKLSSFRKQARYIMQDDVLLPHLTVMEAMRFAAQLKLPIHTPKKEIISRISEILQTMGIYACAETRTSNLSGGERKRLAIAFELITNPPVLLFDEPTTGLDSSSCYTCVSLLKSLANDGGRTIVATIHQPSAKIFELFDSLYLLSEGHCLYQGPTRSLTHFLDTQSLCCPVTYNPADFALEVASGEYGIDSVTHMREVTRTLYKMSRSRNCGGSSSGNSTADFGIESCPTSNPEDSEDGISNDGSGKCSKTEKFMHEFVVLTKRSWVCISREAVLTHLRFSITLIMALLLGIIYKDHGKSATEAMNNCGGIFFQSLFLIFSSLMATIFTFPLEREVVVREHLNCWYSLNTYYLARTVADIPFQFFFPLMFISITYYMTGQPLEWFRFSLVCTMGLILSLICQSVGMFFGAICRLETCVFLAPLSTIPFILFNGLFTKMTTIPAYVRWIAHISYARYTIQSIIFAIYGFDREDLHCDLPYCFFKEPKRILEEIDADKADVLRFGLTAFAMLIVLRILIYFGLRYKIAQAKQ